MPILRKILILVIQILFFAVCPAQPREKIDSLKKVLLTAKNIQRVDCLNALGSAYLFSSTGTAYYFIKRDSSILFSNQALDEARRIHYVQGMADALFNIGKFKDDLREKENDFLNAISLYRQCNNTDTLGQAYFLLGEVLRKEANFPGAIEAYRKAEELFAKANDSWNLGVNATFIGLTYGVRGDFEKAFDYSFRALQLREKYKQQEPFGVIWALCNLGRLFKEVEDYPAAIDYYYTKPREYAKANGISLGAFFFNEIAECWWRMHQNDSALHYMQGYALTRLHDTAALHKSLADTGETDFNIGQMHLIKNEYDPALRIFLHNMKSFESQYERAELMETLAYIGEAYLGKGDNANALIYARKLLDIALSTGARQYIRDGTKMIWRIYHHEKSVDSAYLYYQQYVAMKDSVSNYRFLSQMTSFKEAAASEKKELEFQQNLAREALGKKLLAAGIIFILLIAVFVFRNMMLKRKNAISQKEILQNELQIQKLESEKTNSDLQQQASEMEMQALRAQMNPHFIFNSLNSINRFILQNNRLQASEYLTKFSKLVRLILQNSQASLISLESELESMQLYLDLEAVRFSHRFQYKISVPKDLDIEVVKVPPLIIQPFAENSIWHGLMQLPERSHGTPSEPEGKEVKGQLDIEVIQSGDRLIFRIADNGIGRKAAAALAGKSPRKHKSVGLQITTERIKMLQKSDGIESPVTINDLVHEDGSAAGTEVIIRMPLMYE